MLLRFLINPQTQKHKFLVSLLLLVLALWQTDTRLMFAFWVINNSSLNNIFRLTTIIRVFLFLFFSNSTRSSKIMIKVGRSRNSTRRVSILCDYNKAKVTFRVLVFNLYSRAERGLLVRLEGSSKLTWPLNLALLGLTWRFILIIWTERHASHLYRVRGDSWGIHFCKRDIN